MRLTRLLCLILALSAALIMLAACGSSKSPSASGSSGSASAGSSTGSSAKTTPPATSDSSGSSANQAGDSGSSGQNGSSDSSGPNGQSSAAQNPGNGDTQSDSSAGTTQPADPGAPKGLQVVADPNSILVLVNKQYELPTGFVPEDLVYPNVPFIFKEKIEKRELRQVAATALEKLFAGAKKDGIYLAGVSGYRSYDTQKAVFDHYVQVDGLAKAETYSAYPGTSEHQTGLAIDVSGSTGKCAASDCFDGSKEAQWLAKHAWEYGFIVRYPQGKEAITGYEYESWHIRYVGKDVAAAIHKKGITLEEYLGKVPVTASPSGG